MYLAEEVTNESTATFAIFDIFMIIFTVLIAIGMYRLLKAEKRNLFALGFTAVCLLTFLAVDFLMVLSWTGHLKDFQTMVFGS